jgi:cell fate (sporulation/competence/biofilm development) regulator YmcA (YheA/YmcA/DUF963 family)
MKEDEEMTVEAAAELRAMALIYQHRNKKEEASELLKLAEQIEQRTNVIEMRPWQKKRGGTHQNG